MKAILRLLVGILVLVPALCVASSDHITLDPAPIDSHDAASLQRGARLFVNYCLNCHSAGYMRYNRLTDLGLTEQQIKENLMFASEKVGDTMTVALNSKDAARWFGAQPPDLSVIARSRGADWIYTYLRTFYRDESRPTGWNNVTFPNVGMPHVLWELQGQQTLESSKADGEHHGAHASPKLVLAQAGTLGPKQYDAAVADLVNYLVFQGEPSRSKRVQIGILTLLFLGVMFVFAYALKKEYWKDIH
ncbi:MAG: cytochrome c1 [Betaproteobacteria bacterium]|jgi:ubiquinol-cytochrome c reductase cytochrome c1 subunit